MSKNDNVVRVWTSQEPAEKVSHWYFDYEWCFCTNGTIGEHEVFCLNDRDHEPTFVATKSLDGLLPEVPEHSNFEANQF